MEFFHIDDIVDTPTKNRPNYAFMTTEEQKQNYFQETFDRFIDEYVIGDDDAIQREPGDAGAHTGHACKTSAHAQGLYFQIGRCKCELHNKNVCF